MDENEKHQALLEEARRIAKGEIFLGLGIAAAGGVITWITYAAASEGDTYFVFWGLVIYGGYRLLKGLYYLSSPESLLQKMPTNRQDQNRN